MDGSINVLFCMICQGKGKLKNVSEVFKTKKKDSYLDVIYKCFFIQFLDKHFERKNKICRECIANLKNCYEFRFKLEIAHQRLYKIHDYQAKLKVELDFKEETLKNHSILSVEPPCNDEATSFSFEYDGYTEDKEIENDDLNYSNDPCGTDNEWSTNTDDVLVSTGYYNEMRIIESRVPYILPTLSDDCTQCPICEEQIDDKSELEIHYNKHNTYVYLCEICGHGYSSKFIFNRHISKHYDVTFSCTDCDKIYTSKSGFQFHYKRVHLKMKSYSCGRCKLKFSECNQRKIHMRDVHGMSEEFNCDQCGKLFKQKIKLKDHIRRFHLRERNRVCNLCPASFYSKGELKKHITKHTGIKNHHCQFCGKAFGHRQYLSEHLKIHLNIKKFKCDICGKAFIQKCSLRGHMRTNHRVKENNL